jgi:anti-sigma B factor antagonist
MTNESPFDWTQPASFGVQTVHEDGTSRLLLAGELDIASAPTLRTALDTELDQRKAIIVDCEKLVFIDLNGVRVLVHALTRAAAAGTKLRVVNARDAVLRLLSLTGLDTTLLGDSDQHSLN